MFGLFNKEKRALNRRIRALYEAAHVADEALARVQASEEGLALCKTLESWPWQSPSRRLAIGIFHLCKARSLMELADQNPARFGELSVEAYEESLRHLEQSDGTEWNRAMVYSSLSYADRPSGDAGTNLEQAISRLEEAIPHISPTDERELLADAYGNLSVFLAGRKQGDPTQNLKDAINAKSKMLRYVSKENEPEKWADATASLGSLYGHIEDDQASANLEKAISLIEEAISHRAPKRSSASLATMSMHLIRCYSRRREGIGASNWDRAVQIGSDTLRMLSEAGDRVSWAKVQITLAAVWADRRDGRAKDNFDNALKCIEAALTVFTEDRFPVDHARAQHLYRRLKADRIAGAKPEDVHLSLDKLRQAFQATPPDTNASDWIQLGTDLAGMLYDLRGPEREAALEEAIDIYQQVLAKMSPETHPAMWPMVMGNLANAFAVRLSGDKADNIEEAIRIQQEALLHINQSAHPHAWAYGTWLLAASYSDRLLGYPADNNEKAICLLEEALVIVDEWSYPHTRRDVLETLGTAYQDRVRGSRLSNLERAVAALEGAKRLRDKAEDIEHWVRIDQKLLGAERQLHSLREDQDLSSNASNHEQERKKADPAVFFAHLTENAEAIDPAQFPQTWFSAQLALGDAYINYPLSDTSDLEFGNFVAVMVSQIERAVETYEKTLAVVGEDKFPLHWCIAKRRISTAYELLAHFVSWRSEAFPNEAHDAGELEAASKGTKTCLERAAAAMRDVLSVNTVDRLSRLFLGDAIRLANLESQLHNWEEALKAYASAAAAADYILADSEASDVEAEQTLAELGDLAALAPIAAIECGHVHTALELAEAGRARLLAKTLSLNALFSEPAAFKELRSIQGQIRDLEARLAAPLTIDRATPLDSLMELRTELKELIDKERFSVGPDFKDIETMILDICSDGSVIVLPCQSRRGGRLLAACVTNAEVRYAVVDTPDITDLSHLYAYRSANRSRSWEQAYLRYQSDKLPEYLWRATVDATAPIIAKAFVLPLESALQQLNIEKTRHLRILPNGPIGHLPLASANGSADEEPLLEQHSISFVPSLTSLHRAHKRPSAEPLGTIAICSNPTRGPQSTGLEERAVSSFFPDNRVISVSSPDLTKQSILTALSQSRIWHFASHGRFVREDPSKSGVQLPDGEWLTMQEIVESPDLFAPDLVVLSACETGLYGLKSLPNEFVGLPNAYLQAGARGVLATLWPVKSDPTALVLSKFYECLIHQGLGPAEAIRRAQLWLKEAETDELITLLETMVDEGIAEVDEVSQVCGRLQRFQEKHAGEFGSKPFRSAAYWGGFVYYGI